MVEWDFSLDFLPLFVFHPLPKFCLILSSNINLLSNIFYTKYFVLTFSIEVFSPLSNHNDNDTTNNNNNDNNNDTGNTITVDKNIMVMIMIADQIIPLEYTYRGYPAKRALPAMLTHGRYGPFGRIPSICGRNMACRNDQNIDLYSCDDFALDIRYNWTFSCEQVNQ